MKEKTHLIYGIIIGILLFACLGSSIGDQKNFKEIRVAFWSPVDGYCYYNELGRQSIAKEKPNIPTLPPGWMHLHAAVDSIRANGWTIIEYLPDAVDLREKGGWGKFLIGR